MQRTEVARFDAAIAVILLASSCGNGGAVSNSGDSGSQEAAADSTEGIDSTGPVGPCGDLDQPCCANHACNEVLACDDVAGDPAASRCVPCGKKGQLCCNVGFCEPGLACAVPLAPAVEGAFLPDGPVCREIPDSAACITSCVRPGGEYCGRIGDGCSRFLECGSCAKPGFTCGGAGVHGLCGASPDSGTCDLVVCRAPNGTYCGPIGDGCGSTIDCGSCPGGVTCGESVPNVCDEPLDGNSPRDPPPPLPPPPPPPPNLR